MYIPRPPVHQWEAAAPEKMQNPNKNIYNSAAFSSYAARHLATVHTAEALAVFGAGGQSHDQARALIQRCVMLVLLKPGLPGLDEFAPAIDRLFSCCSPSWTAEFDKLLVAICRKEAAENESVASMRRLVFEPRGGEKLTELARMRGRAREAAVLYTAIYVETVAMRDAAKRLHVKGKKSRSRKGKTATQLADAPCSISSLKADEDRGLRDTSDTIVFQVLRQLMLTKNVEAMQRLQEQMAKTLGLEDVTKTQTKTGTRKRKRAAGESRTCARAKRHQGF